MAKKKKTKKKGTKCVKQRGVGHSFEHPIDQQIYAVYDRRIVEKESLEVAAKFVNEYIQKPHSYSDLQKLPGLIKNLEVTNEIN